MQLDVKPFVLAYLVGDSAMFRAETRHANPTLDTELASPEVREAILTWLAAPDREPNVPDFVASLIGHLRAKAQPTESATIRPFTLDSDPLVRQRAYEFLMTLNFAPDNREALLALLQTMLVDEDDSVRIAATRYVDRANASGDLAPFLRRWHEVAAERGWGGEAGAHVDRLLASPVDPDPDADGDGGESP